MAKSPAPTEAHDEILRKIGAVVRQLRRTARLREEEPTRTQLDAIEAAVNEVDKAWSQSFAGYHALIYIEGLRPRRPGERFDSEWGPSRGAFSSSMSGEWAEFDFDEVLDEVYRRAEITEADRDRLDKAALSARDLFQHGKRTLDALLRALLQTSKDENLKELHERLASQEAAPTANAFAQGLLPRQLVSRDSTAVYGGIQLPPHLQIRATANYWAAQFHACELLAGRAESALEYLRTKFRLEGTTTLRSGGKVFVGHGRSAEWLKLKDFLASRLDFEVVAFDSVPPAGKTTQQRLDEMKDAADFAFLVFTTEDTQGDGTERARQNVVHEYGIMETKLGRNRAIVLHEEGCDLPSNLTNVTDIRFPRAHVEYTFEEVRRVLEREGLL